VRTRSVGAVSMRARGDWRLMAILAVAVLLRVAVALYLGDVVDAPPLLTDQRSYHALGYRLVDGHGFSFPKAWYPFTPADTPTAHWSFLYSLFVAGVYAVFGPHPLAVRLVQAVLGGLLMPWLGYRLTMRVFGGGGESRKDKDDGSSIGGELVALVAAAVTAVYAYFALYAATLMTETFFIIAVLWTLDVALSIVYQLQEDLPISWRRGALLGVSLGVATLLRQSILPWVPVLGLVIAWIGMRRRRLADVVKLGISIGIALMLFVLPWTYRNYRVYDRFLLLNSNTGFAMYSAQHPIHGMRFSEFEAAPLPEGLAWGHEPDMYSALMAQGAQFVLEDPVRYVLLSLSRVRAFFEFWPTPDTSLLHNLGRVGSFGLVLPLMIYGLVLAGRDGEVLGRVGLILVFAAVYSVMHILTWAMVRYRLPVDAVMMPIVGWALVDLYQRFSLRLPMGRRTTPEGSVQPTG